MTEPSDSPIWSPPAAPPVTPPLWTAPPVGSAPPPPPPRPPVGFWPDPPSPGSKPRPPRSRRVRGLVAIAAVAALIGALLVFAGTGYSRHGDGSSTQLLPTSPSQSPTTPTTPATPSTTDSGAAAQSAATSKLDVGVVDIDTRLGYENARAAGTGMIITSSGEVLTNTHVISGATSIRVTVVSTGRSYDATVMGSDATHDVALLKMKGASNLDTVQLGDSSDVTKGDAVTAVGNAGGVGGIPSEATGHVTGLNQSINVSDETCSERARLSGLIETDAALQPGDSGGPLYDADGKVIGMDTAADSGGRLRPAGNDSYAIAIDTAETIVKQIESGKGTSAVQIGTRGFLGVEVQGSGCGDQNGPLGGGGDGTSGATAGAVVASVLDGTPAADAGLQAGDVITAIDGQTVNSNDSLSARLHGHHPGDSVKVTWTDTSGDSHSTTINLTTGPAA